MPELNEANEERRHVLTAALDDSDEGEAFDDDEDGDDDEDAPHLARVAARPAATPRRQATPAQKPPPRRSATAQIDENVERDLESIFAELGAGAGECKVTLTRLEPSTDPKTGERIAGHLDSYTRPVTQDEIKHRFGGGRYQVLVMGPNKGGRGSAIKFRKVIEIAGPPKSLNTDDKKENEADSLMRFLAEKAEKDRERDERKLEEMRRESKENQNTILQLVAKMAERPKDDPDRPMLEMMREENKRREDEYKAELRRREEQDRREREERECRWKEEREEQRRRDEEAKRQHEAEMKRQEQQMQLQLKQLELQQQATAERLKAEASAQKDMMTFMVTSMQKNDSEKESRAQQMLQLQVENMKQSGEMSAKFMEQQMRFLMEQLKNKDDFFSGLEKFQALQELMNPSDNTPAWERGVDKVVEAAQGIIPGLAMFNASSAQKTPPQQPPQGQKRIAPGSVAVVEEYDEYEDSDETEDVETREAEDNEPRSPESSKALEPLQTKPQPTEDGATENEEVNGANPIEEFQSYAGQTDNAIVFTLLVQNLDLALQRDLSVDEIYEKCLKDLPSTQAGALRMAPSHMILTYIEQYVPADWRLRSLDAEDTVKAVMAKFKSVKKT